MVLRALRESGFTATIPHSLPNSLNATTAVPFFEWKWNAGSMSRLDGEVELQTQRLKMDVRFEIPLGLDQMISVRSSDGSTDLGTSAGWLLKATLICVYQGLPPKEPHLAPTFVHSDTKVC
jgi:hypothetical protein